MLEGADLRRLGQVGMLREVEGGAWAWISGVWGGGGGAGVWIDSVWEEAAGQGRGSAVYGEEAVGHEASHGEDGAIVIWIVQGWGSFSFPSGTDRVRKIPSARHGPLKIIAKCTQGIRLD
jgi:hypothetical protein